jgi:hypothetical protein
MRYTKVEVDERLVRLPENLRLGRKDHAYTTFIPPDEILLPEVRLRI